MFFEVSFTWKISHFCIKWWLMSCSRNANDNKKKIINISHFSVKLQRNSPHYCVCVKRITHCNCLCSSSPSSRFSASLIWNIREFGATNYFTDHWTANTIQSFVPIKITFFGCILFQNKWRRNSLKSTW